MSAWLSENDAGIGSVMCVRGVSVRILQGSGTGPPSVLPYAPVVGILKRSSLSECISPTRPRASSGSHRRREQAGSRHWPTLSGTMCLSRKKKEQENTPQDRPLPHLQLECHRKFTLKQYFSMHRKDRTMTPPFVVRCTSGPIE